MLLADKLKSIRVWDRRKGKAVSEVSERSTVDQDTQEFDVLADERDPNAAPETEPETEPDAVPPEEENGEEGEDGENGESEGEDNDGEEEGAGAA